jgi:hypothetical protein
MPQRIHWGTVETQDTLRYGRNSPPWPDEDPDDPDGSPDPLKDLYDNEEDNEGNDGGNDGNVGSNDDNEDEDDNDEDEDDEGDEGDEGKSQARQARQPTQPTRSTQPPPAKRRRTQNIMAQLDNKAKIFVIRCAVRDADLYSKLSRQNFWSRISQELEEELGIKYTTLSRAVNSLVKKRKGYLAGVGRGEERRRMTLNTID